MDRWDYQMVNQHVHLMAHILEGMPVQEAADAAERAGAIGPIVDPTLYREKSEALRVDLELLRAAATFQAACVRIKREAIERAGKSSGVAMEATPADVPISNV